MPFKLNKIITVLQELCISTEQCTVQCITRLPKPISIQLDYVRHNPRHVSGALSLMLSIYNAPRNCMKNTAYTITTSIQDKNEN